MASSNLSTECIAAVAKLGLMRTVIREELLHDLARHNRVDQSLSDQLFEEFKQENNLTSPEETQQFLRVNFLEEDDLRLLAERQAALFNYIQTNFQRKAEARFLQRKDGLDQIVYSLIRVNSQGLARELHLQISEGEADFPELASRYSEGPERLTRGIVGPAPLNQGHPELVQRIRSAAAGELQSPFQIEQWWVVVRLEERIDASYDEMTAQRMASELFEEWLQESVENRIEAIVRDGQPQ